MAGQAPVRPGARWWVPEKLEPGLVAQGIEGCKGCELYADATHGVPGEGPLDAPLMMVGEQPGDQEDRAGRPFVGPAGKLLAKAMDEAGLDPDAVFRTNAVKHFRWETGRASNRLHKSPGRGHVVACGPWLVAEIEMVRPRGVVLLGATAGGAVFGPKFRVGASRGRRLEWPAPVASEDVDWRPAWALATAHPSSVLRSRTREEDFAALVDDLRVTAGLLSED